MRIKRFSLWAVLCAVQVAFALPQVEDANDSSSASASSTSGYLSSPGPIATSDSLQQPRPSSTINDDILARLNALENQVQQLQGRVDELQHGLKQIQTESAQQFLILNQKIAEKSTAAPVSAPAKAAVTASDKISARPSAVPATAPQEPKLKPPVVLSADQQEKATYEAAYGLISAKAYSDAIDAFKSYLTIYPAGKYAANANYWLGELNANQQAYPEALRYLQLVVDHYPDSSKVPDALLKLGIINKRLGNDAKAQSWFNQLIKKYPDSASAKSAKEYLV